MMIEPNKGSERTVRREGRTFHIRGEIRLRGRRYDVLQHLGTRHRPRLLVDDPVLRQLYVALVLPSDSSTVQHLRVLRRLPQHADVPHIIDYARQGRDTIILLRWVKGIDLGQYFGAVKRQKVVAPIPYESLRLVRGLGHALWQFHRNAQLIHGDIKPPNLIITRKVSRLVMIDFGSAWPIEITRDRIEGDGISVVYAAPEQQTEGAPIDARADQFSATLILYQFLTGTIPFADLGGQAGRPGFRNELAGSLTPPSEIARAVQLLPKLIRRSLDRIVRRGLEFDPDERYPTTSAWLDALKAVHQDMEREQLRPGSCISSWQRFIDGLAGMIFERSRQ